VQLLFMGLLSKFSDNAQDNEYTTLAVKATNKDCSVLAGHIISCNGRLLLQSMHTYDSLPRMVISLPYENVLSNLSRHPPTLLYLDLTFDNISRGRIYIRLQPELDSFIKNLPALFTGENGSSILNATCCPGSNSTNLRFLIKKCIDDISSCKREAIPIQYGDVICIFDGYLLNNLSIYYEKSNTYDDRYVKIGHIESGLEVAKFCRELGRRNQEKITISECGLVLEM
ncbi:unnamed protein product, partial [Meganyctiphanes norvegica]